MEVFVQQKLKAFKKAAPSPMQDYHQLIAVGDGEFEMYAANDIHFSKCMKHAKARLKTIKMYDDPILEVLTAELNVIHGALTELCRRDEDVHLDFDMIDGKEIFSLLDVLDSELHDTSKIFGDPSAHLAHHEGSKAADRELARQ